jgi:two-component system response regulator GlrR
MSDNRSSLGVSGHGAGGNHAAAGATPSGRVAAGGTSSLAPHSPTEGVDASGAGRRHKDRIILASPTTQQVVDQATAIARSNSPVLITGEPGTGRQHLARAIHAWSQRASGPLIHFSAAATADGLHARELFGSTADADPLSRDGGDGSLGALAEAADGTLIIERIDLLSTNARARLAEAWRNGSYFRDGAAEPVVLRTRILATGSPDSKSLFAGEPIQTLDVAPLSERKEDILPLAAHFLAEFTEQEGLTAVGFTVDARRWLVEEAWTGNVRELRERIRQAIDLSGSGSVSAEGLMLSTEGEDVPSFKEAKRAFETRYVEGLLRRCSGNISRAARLAKKDRKDFYDVIRRTGVDPTRFRG